MSRSALCHKLTLVPGKLFLVVADTADLGGITKLRRFRRRITPAAVAAFKAADYDALHRALNLHGGICRNHVALSLEWLP